MADPSIKIKRSSVAGKIPTSDQLPLGEIALNTYDGKLYASKNVGIGTTVFAVNSWTAGVGTNTYNTYFTEGNVGIASTLPSSKFDVIGDIKISGVTTTNTLSIGATQVISAARQLQNIASLDATTTATIEAAVASAPNTFTDLRISGFSTLSAASATSISVSGLSTFSGYVSAGTTVGIGTIIRIVPYDTLNSGTLAFEGSAGQLLSITNNLTSGSIFSVNDVSGIPSIDVNADGTIQLGVFGGNIGVGTTGPTSKFSVLGDALVNGISTFSGGLNASQGVDLARVRVTGIATLGQTNTTGLSNAGVSTLGNATASTAVITGFSTLGSISANNVSVSGVSTFTNGPVLVGSGTSTGTVSQRLQVTGGGYFSGNVGIGTTISSEPGLSVLGKIQLHQVADSSSRLIFRAKPGNLFRWNIDNDSTETFRIFREDDATSANGAVAVSISTTGTLTATKFVGDGSSLTNLPSSGGSGTNYWNQNTIGINTVSNVGIGTTNSTSRLTVSGSASISGILTADQIYTSNNGNGQNVRIGDDAWLGDINVANTIRLSGAQDPAKGFIVFGSSDAVALGRTGTGPLYYGGDFAVSGISTFSGGVNASQGIDAARLNVSGIATISGLRYPTSDGSNGQVLTTDGLGNLSFQDPSGISTTTTSTSQVSISTFSAATYSSAIYNIQITRGSEIHFTTLNLIHNGTSVFLTEYGTIKSSGNLASFDSDISGGNVRILTTPDSITSTTFKFNRTLITTGSSNTTTTTLATIVATQIDNFAASTYSSAKLEIEVTRGSSIQLSTLNLIHNGVDVYLTEYAILKSDEILATFDSTISGVNVVINATSTSATSTTYKIRKTFIT